MALRRSDALRRRRGDRELPSFSRSSGSPSAAPGRWRSTHLRFAIEAGPARGSASLPALGGWRRRHCWERSDVWRCSAWPAPSWCFPLSPRTIGGPAPRIATLASARGSAIASTFPCIAGRGRPRFALRVRRDPPPRGNRGTDDALLARSLSRLDGPRMELAVSGLNPGHPVSARPRTDARSDLLTATSRWSNVRGRRRPHPGRVAAQPRLPPAWTSRLRGEAVSQWPPATSSTRRSTNT